MADVITNEIKTEGAPTNDPVDKGGPTAFGISEAANPDAWKNGPPTEAQARAIYQSKYVDGPGFSQIKDKQLQAQLIDFGVNSGPAIAIQKLQEILHVKVDGVLGPQTVVIANGMNSDDINTALAVSRVKMIGKIVTKNPSQLKFLNGWLDRALQFLV